MNDLSGLSWSSKPNSTSPNNQNQAGRPSNFGISPVSSGRSTPANAGKLIGSKPATPANDSFSSLLSSKPASKPQAGLSLQERQRQLQEEKARQTGFGQKQNESAQDARFWDSFGGNSSIAPSKPFTPPATTRTQSPFVPVAAPTQSSDDILAAFNSDAKVDTSSHFPPPKAESSFADDDDDPFGLGSMPQASSKPITPQPIADGDGDDDILGMLGKPVDQVPKPARATRPAPEVVRAHQDEAEMPSQPSNPRDKAVAELVDMGFPADKAARALAQTQSGTNVQEAVGIILNQAHQQASQRSKSRGTPVLEDEPSSRRQSPGPRSSSQPRRGDSRTPTGEKDVSQYASDIGTSLFKSANSLWKTGQKKVQKAMADFQQEGDSSQPKWMRDTQTAQSREQSADPELPTRLRKSQNPLAQQNASSTMTDEAMLLESGGSRPQRKQERQLPSQDRRSNPFEQSSHEQQHVPQRNEPPWAAEAKRRPPEPEKRPTSRVTRQEVEEQSSQAYISPARRKKTPQPTAEPPLTGQPASSRAAQSSPAALHPNNPFASKPSAPTPSARKSTPIQVRPQAPPRPIPSVSPSALTTSAAHRQKGSEAFKRGDFAAAHGAYSDALRGLPDKHPILIVILCNRALTGIKTGEPKGAIADADQALSIIGPSKGQDEKISMGADGDKDMREFFGKALMRKAEAYEHMEKYFDALKVWREAVEAGVGGFVSMQGRTRCEKATKPKPAPKPAAARPTPKPTPKLARSALSDLGGASAASGSEAASIQRLRQANAAAEKADDEKFALADSVDAKLGAWKGSKADNLRALLGSLDNVLWPEAGWKKVGMSDLVMPNKVKIIYMKAIAKVHPDKISQTATTEQRMISAAVFSTLNEAWDKFKQDNGL